jgi:hypothetical protein
MSESDLEAQIAATKAYEEFFVPGLFGNGPCAERPALRSRLGITCLMLRAARECSREKLRRG